MQLPDAPYKILALAPFTMAASRPWQQAPLPVDRQSLDDAMQALAIAGNLPLESELCPARGLNPHFDDLKSLHPDGMLKSIPYLANLVAAKEFIVQARRNGMQASRILGELRQRWPDLPVIDLKDSTSKPNDPKSSSSLDNLLDMVALPGQDQRQNPVDQDEIRQIDTLLQKVLNAIFEWPAFRQMEAAWRGLRLLLQQGVAKGGALVEIVPIHPESLASTLEVIAPLMIDHPPGLVLLDLPFDNSPLAMERLATVAQWADTLMAPLIAWTQPSFLQIDTWDQLATLPFLPNHVDQPAYAKYRKLRQSADGHWISLTCNRFLIRYPYGPDNTPRGVPFTEASQPWIPPVWALGALVAQSVCQTGWPTHLTHRQQFTIQDLALHSPSGQPPMAVEANFDRDRQDQFIRAGLTPLICERDTAFATQAIALSGTSLPYQLLVCRMTQFLLWCKDNLPAETEPSALESQLNLAFQVLSEQSRPPAFESVIIATGQPDGEGRIPVNISIIPSATVLPSRKLIEIGLNW
jgi:type VI secretion system protein ImpC